MTTAPNNTQRPRRWLRHLPQRWPVSLMAAVLLISASAFGQTAVPQSGSGSTITDPNAAAGSNTLQAVSDTIIVPVFPLVAAQLMHDQPLPVNFALGAGGQAQGLEGIDPKLTEGVVAQGFARKVIAEQDGQQVPIGQVVVTSVAKGDRVEPIDQTGLTAQFEKPDDTLFPEEEVQVSGSRTALVAALQRLQDQPEEEPEKDTVEATNDGKDGSDGSGAAGSNATSNPDAAGYQSPDTTQAAAAAPEPVTELRLTTDGCPLRIDEAQGAAIQQSKAQTFTDGVLTKDGECSDGDKRYPLIRDYDACDPAVDLQSMVVTALYRNTFTDGDGNHQTVGNCTPDAGKTWVITESAESCAPIIDLAGGAITPQTALSYTNAKGQKIEVRACGPSTTQPRQTLTKSFGSCSDAVDLAALTVSPQFIYTYTDAKTGAVVSVSQCTPDTSATKPITKDYQACESKVNLAALSAVQQYKLTYTDSKGQQHILSDCTADPSRTLAITEDLDLCEARIDLESGKAIPQAALVYKTPEGEVVQVRDCQDSTIAKPAPLVRDYNACSDVIDLAGLKAYRQYTLTYTDLKGAKQTVAQCARDDASVMAISEKVGECPVAIDLTARTATVQVLLVYTDANSKEQEVRGCAPSKTASVMPIEKAYGACADQINLGLLTANPRYQSIYVDGAGVTHTVSDCTTDAETVYQLKENTAACPVSLDWDKKQAVTQATLVYANRDQKTVQARDCAASLTVPPAPMVQDAAACPMRHDFEAKKSYQMALWKYALNGQSYQASPCADTGVTYDHSTASTVNGEYICQPIVTLSTNTVTIQGRTQILVNGAPVYISECAPIPGSTVAAMETTNGCTNPASWSHNIAAGVSYAQGRWYYTKPNGQQVFVTNCQTLSSGQTYSHSHTRTGWQTYDASLYAYPLNRISITVAGVPYTIAENYLVSGSAQVPYTLDSENLVGTGNYAYEGCKKYEKTQIVKQWRRPDNSTFSQMAGAGADRIANANACTTSRPDTPSAWPVRPTPAGDRRGHVKTMLESAGVAGIRCEFIGSRRVTREDGQVIADETVSKIGNGAYTRPVTTDGTGFAYCGPEFGYCPRQISDQYSTGIACPLTPTSSEVGQWLGELGW